MLIIGEKINTSSKSVRNAIVEGDVNFLQNLARSQKEGGADYLDVNVSTFSVTAEQEKLETILPLAKEFNSAIIALAMGEEGISSKAEKRLKACRKIAESTQKHGIALRKLYFDPLALSIAADTCQGLITLETLKGIKSQLPEAKTTLGLSNISFGLPGRSLINRSFLLMAIYAGLDSAILAPLDKKLMSAIKAGEMILGRGKQ